MFVSLAHRPPIVAAVQRSHRPHHLNIWVLVVGAGAVRAAGCTYPFLAYRPTDLGFSTSDVTRKDPDVLVAAYNDQTVAGQFNKSVLSVINRELHANFDLDAFRHVALWDADHERIEMRLRSKVAQTVKIPALDLAVDFVPGEALRIEISTKFRLPGLANELRCSGLDLARWFTTPAQRVGIALATPTPSGSSLATAAGRTTSCVR
ncbi:L-histidine N(alpha)-methyltransferase [Streptomyces sp. NPDC048508]|uniref:L-histidine N(alpha)-methyltransferase n=1 Tax=Streptomyces sp. NPDC048508 TaxID=3365561 RepID=UPI00371E0BD0